MKAFIDDAEIKALTPLQTNVSVYRWQQGVKEQALDILAEEVAVAFVFNGISHVVMMASPNDLANFALGFSMSEAIIESPNELYSITIKPLIAGIELQLSISSRRMAALKQKRRNLVGRTGCGLCGAESLAQAVLPVKVLTETQLISDSAVQISVNQLESFQPLQAKTGAHHGAAWCDLDGNIQLVREDVGRHNALDKLIGALYQEKVDFSTGFVLISSRASYEMVQKVVSASITTLVSVSAPTALAFRIASEVNLQLIGFARHNRHVHYSGINLNLKLNPNINT